MKKLLNISGLSRMAVAGIALGVLFLSACSKNDSTDFDPPPTAGLMLVNLAPDKSAVGFTISGNQFGIPALGYTNYSGRYLPIYPGNRELRSFDFNNGSTITSSTNTYSDSLYYSAFVIGNAGQYRHVVVKDDYTNVLPVSGKAWVRYINAVTDSTATPTVTLAGTTEATTFGGISAFRQVDAGSVSAGITGEDFNTTRTFTLAENKIYTILFIGQPTATDPALQVQAKFIENGTASN